VLIKWTTQTDSGIEVLVQHTPPGCSLVAGYAAVAAVDAAAVFVVILWHHDMLHSRHEHRSLCHCGSSVIPLDSAVQVYLLTEKI
jgi:hypothetical protein